MRYLTFDSQLARYVVKQGARQEVLTTRGGRRLIMLEGEDVLAWAAEYRARLGRLERRGWSGASCA